MLTIASREKQARMRSVHSPWVTSGAGEGRELSKMTAAVQSYERRWPIPRGVEWRGPVRASAAGGVDRGGQDVRGLVTRRQRHGL